jgi:uncharacterized protein with HEPN domain
MDIEIKAWIFDILTAVEEIESFLADVSDFAAYQNDVRTKRAIERNLEIIGEAMNRILKKDPFIQFTNSRKIVETRNRIVHGYDTVSDEIVWSLILTYIPILKQESIAYLTE